MQPSKPLNPMEPEANPLCELRQMCRISQMLLEAYEAEVGQTRPGRFIDFRGCAGGFLGFQAVGGLRI